VSTFGEGCSSRAGRGAPIRFRFQPHTAGLEPTDDLGVSNGRPIHQGQAYDLRWDLQPDDYLFKPGRRIGLVVVSTDHDNTIRPDPGKRLTLQPSNSQISLPVVGGHQALGF
jgi:X-Pro dipeptidyl-peptidase